MKDVGRHGEVSIPPEDPPRQSECFELTGGFLATKECVMHHDAAIQEKDTESEDIKFKKSRQWIYDLMFKMLTDEPT